jgi:hypothetical protein
MMTADDLTWYERLCGELDRLESEFQPISQDGPFLHFGLFNTCYWHDQPVGLKGWQAFQTSAAGQIGNGEWEEWESCSSDFCGCFFGNANLLPRFRRLAESGILILTTIDRGANRGGPIPVDYSLDLPDRPNWLDWIWLLFETANLSTARLRFNDYRICNLPISQNLDDLNENQLWETAANGFRFPRHPLYRTLSMDLFLSSAEAIRLWRHRVDAVAVDGQLDDGVVSLPDSPEVTQIDGQRSITAQEGASEKPDWNGYELRGRNRKVIKIYSESATRVIPLLNSFQNEGWPKCLSDPCGIRQQAMALAEKRGTNPKSETVALKNQRRDTVKELNAAQDEIVFTCKGGIAVIWDWRDQLDVEDSMSGM